MNLRDIPITSLIPQRPPFVMVDSVLTCEETDSVTEFKVREDNIFLDDMALSPAGIIENMHWITSGGIVLSESVTEGTDR